MSRLVSRNDNPENRVTIVGDEKRQAARKITSGKTASQERSFMLIIWARVGT